jgi:CheY-like chemotaxis protein
VCVILIVEDDPAIRDCLAELVLAHGHTHFYAANGHEALAWLENPIEAPCLILLDLQMPVMDGWGLLSALRQAARWINLPVIICSGDVEYNVAPPIPCAKAFWSKPPDPVWIASMHQYCPQHCDSREPKSA